MIKMASHFSELWAQLIIEELVRLGLNSICIAPGSRSTPLTIAAAQHPTLTCFTHFDERGLGFFALGIAKSTQQPVAILTTSGSAVANLLPALVEAKQSANQLLVLSADRPQELIGVGANQAIDQRGIFSNFVVGSDDLPAASSEISALSLLSRIDQLWQTMLSLQGPVQLNCPFREPLYPNKNPIDFENYLTELNTWQSSEVALTELEQPNENKQVLNIAASSKVLVIIARQVDATRAQRIADWAQQQQLPVLTDVQAQLLHHPHCLANSESLALVANTTLDADVILQFGTQLVGKSLATWLEQQVKRGCQWHLIENSPCVFNPARLAQQQWLELDLTRTRIEANHAYLRDWTTQASKVEALSQQFLAQHIDSELGLASVLCSRLTQLEQIFIGNSLGIRLFDRFASSPQALRVHASRGASGIDGLLATSFGMHQAQPGHSLALIGDTSALYDLNSMALWSRLSGSMVVVVVNNDGGEIFAMLDGAGDETLQRNYYQMPHGLSFEFAAKQFNINYQVTSSSAELIENVSLAFEKQQHLLIEYKVPAGQASSLLKQFNQLLRSQLCTEATIDGRLQHDS
ncbi:2-succinyl-5-enolpyruvyl-6-hydroxy-3-cyclohexene-1-carboxylic-acid synthase [Alginatibacterium sediminis]|uniref:2-succinyl-5-enolpyruvyl-6-hydroxy-3-cyclohexene-1-carboxylate synthase n=1 Tax=Alginatibacterium sediminis TaxID=2164068 RepID=A0A420E6Q6_9ALTE|nr:2-succinyl-5-enolpyruvyl-6-hydroxy-3-cyclohexene-1-carboxylic-acid synthase [Alginatibacterium sediminis]RKF14320.1 2-succinyl-5-enolpyruvyl-6-hydroxy-3-cyclohexene-1-carboxylic-acid synthase [Alginatibacterium sediminis]